MVWGYRCSALVVHSWLSPVPLPLYNRKGGKNKWKGDYAIKEKTSSDNHERLWPCYVIKLSISIKNTDSSNRNTCGNGPWIREVWLSSLKLQTYFQYVWCTEDTYLVILMFNEPVDHHLTWGIWGGGCSEIRLRQTGFHSTLSPLIDNSGLYSATAGKGETNWYILAIAWYNMLFARWMNNNQICTLLVVLWLHK